MLLLNDSNQYRPHFVCDVLDFVPGQDIACERQIPGAQTCEKTGKCQSYATYSILDVCDLECIDLAWLSAFTVPITYSGVDSFVTVSDNETCTNSFTTTVGTGNTDQDINETGGGGGGGGGKDSSTPVALGIGLAFAGLVVGVTALAAWVVCKRVRTRKLSKKHDASDPSSSSSSFPHRSVYQPWGQGSSGYGSHVEGSDSNIFVGESVEDQYQEIDDIARRVRTSGDGDERDEDGYNIIQDENSVHDSSNSKDGRNTRPLPLPPKSEGFSPEGGTSTTDDSSASLHPHYYSADLSYYPKISPASPASNSPTTADSTTSAVSEDTKTHPSSDHISSSDASHGPRLQNPKPHKFLRQTSQRDYLGLVNIRSDYPNLNQPSQLNLLRNQHGQMELTTLQGDRPALQNVCSELQIIGLKDGSLCVLGKLNDAFPKDDYQKYFQILNMPLRKHTHDDDSSDSAYVNPDGDNFPTNGGGLARKEPGAENPMIQVIYLGPLELDRGYSVISVEGGDYLRVKDLSDTEESPEDGTYLRVLDIEEANLTDSDGEYLRVLDL